MLISIVIPVYNIEDVITHSLESVCEQTYKNIELILVDDGSTDKSVLVAENYLKNKNIKYRILLQQNQGPSAARNKGIHNAKGDWIITLDGDDYLYSTTLERMLNEAVKFDVKCVFCNYKTVHEDTIKLVPQIDKGSTLITGDKMRWLFFQRKLVPITPGMLLHRSVCEVLMYDEKCRYCEDTLFLWELFYCLDRFVFVNVDLYNYYQRSNSTMHSLKPEKYLLASPRHQMSAQKIQERFPHDKIAPMIYPKFRLAGLRIVCRNNSYKDFCRTVEEDGGNIYISRLFTQTSVKLLVYAMIFCISKKLFYIISK